MIEQGCMVSSLKGHDTGRIYLVLKTDNEFAFVADGKYRSIDNPKKKRIKHLHNLCDNFPDFEQKYKQNKLYDFEIQKKISGILHKN